MKPPIREAHNKGNVHKRGAEKRSGHQRGDDKRSAYQRGAHTRGGPMSLQVLIRKLSEPLRSYRLGKLSGPMLAILFSPKTWSLLSLLQRGKFRQLRSVRDSRLCAGDRYWHTMVQLGRSEIAFWGCILECGFCYSGRGLSLWLQSREIGTFPETSERDISE
jgi:hypothetical protein